MSRLLLQICTGLLALIPIATGIVSMLGVKDPLYRFFGGIWLGVGLAMLWLVPSINGRGRSFGSRTLLDLDRAAPQDLCRLHYSRTPGAPLFIYWQYRLAQSGATL